MIDYAGAVAEHVLLPLLAGGEVRPVGPVGSERALALAGEQGVVVTGGALDEIRARRLRVARGVLPADALGDLGAGDWLLTFALNDLLQVTNPTITDWFGSDRPKHLLDMIRDVVRQVGPPRRLREVVARHASFSRVLELRRIDTRVSWWVGSATFHGAKPPPRLLMWKSVRRVHEVEEEVRVADMAPDTAPWAPAWQAAFAEWLSATPLTDIANAGRSAPAFRWTGATLALIESPMGRNLARRALSRVADRQRAFQALAQATAHIGGTPAEELANAFLAELQITSAGQ
ncbi:MAG: hypothetical protein KC776_08700 [Myxococcales bacterium]|nr:hypothetical protein [Myxococcales bacterium]MCB9575866.1 hypothetical protein [Polyangiaceae bacterium]